MRSSWADFLGRCGIISLSCSSFMLFLVLLEQRRVWSFIGLEHLDWFYHVDLRQIVGLLALRGLAFHPRVFSINHLGDFSRRQSSDHGRNVLNIAICDHTLHLLLLLAQYTFLLCFHPFLQPWLHLTIDIRSLLPVILFAFVVLESRAEEFHAHLWGNDALIADVQSYLLWLSKGTESIWFLQHYLSVSYKFSLL